MEWLNNSSVAQWEQTLTGLTSFAGGTVQEAEPFSGADSCWFDGSMYDPAIHLSGGTWLVNADNTWGADLVGWLPQWVDYYRLQGKAPCDSIRYQQMTMQCSDGSIQNYGPVNVLLIGMTEITVSSQRAGSKVSRRY